MKKLNFETGCGDIYKMEDESFTQKTKKHCKNPPNGYFDSWSGFAIFWQHISYSRWEDPL